MITLLDIKFKQAEIMGMISDFEKQEQAKNSFCFMGKEIHLNRGEKYVGTIISADGSRNHHVVLLPGAVAGKTWEEAREWAASIGGELPDRIEQALLFATAKDEFEEDAYWSNAQHASDSGYAWCQIFGNGAQSSYGIGSKLRARAVRRIEVTV